MNRNNEGMAETLTKMTRQCSGQPVKKKSFKERNPDLDMDDLERNPHIPQDVLAVLSGALTLDNADEEEALENAALEQAEAAVTNAQDVIMSDIESLLDYGDERKKKKKGQKKRGKFGSGDENSSDSDEDFVLGSSRKRGPRGPRPSRAKVGPKKPRDKQTPEEMKLKKRLYSQKKREEQRLARMLAQMEQQNSDGSLIENLQNFPVKRGPKSEAEKLLLEKQRLAPKVESVKRVLALDQKPNESMKWNSAKEFQTSFAGPVNPDVLAAFKALDSSISLTPIIVKKEESSSNQYPVPNRILEPVIPKIEIQELHPLTQVQGAITSSKWYSMPTSSPALATDLSNVSSPSRNSPANSNQVAQSSMKAGLNPTVLNKVPSSVPNSSVHHTVVVPPPPLVQVNVPPKPLFPNTPQVPSAKCIDFISAFNDFIKKESFPMQVNKAAKANVKPMNYGGGVSKPVAIPVSKKPVKSRPKSSKPKPSKVTPNNQYNPPTPFPSTTQYAAPTSTPLIQQQPKIHNFTLSQNGQQQIYQNQTTYDLNYRTEYMNHPQNSNSHHQMEAPTSTQQHSLAVQR